MKFSPENIDLYAVAGNPIAHSKSPQIFNNFFRINNINAYYTRLLAKKFNDILELVKIYGIRGINVTSPFKKDAFQACDFVDDIARKLGAVNTLIYEDNKFFGYNTDPKGVIGAFEDNGIQLHKKTILIIGTGPAAYAAALAVGQIAHSCKISFYSSSSERAEKAAVKFGFNIIKFSPLEMAISNSDVIINCSPNLNINLNRITLTEKQVIFDANYSQSSLNPLALRFGAKVISGESWLINQAIPAIELLTGNKFPKNMEKYELLVDNIEISSREQASNSLEKGNETAKTESHSELSAESIAKDKRNSGKSHFNSGKPIALIGFMGAGKSSVGRKVAQDLNLQLIDLDMEIEKKCGKTISEIFKEDGEEKFREIESQILKESLEVKNSIIACGGGAIISYDNRMLLSEKAYTINLHVSPEIAVCRINDESRPLLAVDNPNENARRLFNVRKDYYIISSEMTINTNHLSLEEVKTQIINAVKSRMLSNLAAH
jgi:shikimate dehydrogenase